MSIEGFKGDIFLADDQLLYLRHQAFKADLSPSNSKMSSSRT